MTPEEELAVLQYWLLPWQHTSKPTYAKDCFFYSDEQDMNATLPYCDYQREPFPRGCCQECHKYISKHQARELILDHLKRRDEGV